MKRSITEANKKNLDQHGYLDKLKGHMCVTGDIQKKLIPDIEDTLSPTSAFKMLKLFLALGSQREAQIHQVDVVGAFLQAKMRSRVFLILRYIYGEVFP